MDATQHAAVFHLQNSHYDNVRPPNFFDHDELNKLNLTRARKRHTNNRGDNSKKLGGVLSDDEIDDKNNNNERGERRLKSVYDCEKQLTGNNTFVRQSTNNSNGEFNNDDISVGSANSSSRFSKRKLSFTPPKNVSIPSSPYRRQDSPLPKSVLDGQWDIIPPTPDKASSDIIQLTTLNSTYFPASQIPNEGFGHRPNGHTPPLFLQELAHLSSLACAVALSTLRNDVEGSESPLDIYIPGSAWPESDPDKLPRALRDEFQHEYHLFTIIRHWLGRDRLPGWRSKYNAARPVLVIGGISQGEINFLQKARGHHAKVTLAFGWLKEFIIREHLDGSLGNVHSAIISRLVQFISDGMLFYHQARKIMYIPFPFPHAQLSVFFSGIMVVAVPFLMDQYTTNVWIGSILTFLVVTCLVGLHEVARELENPFRNVPNEIPLCTIQAMYNEALLIMFSGYNPDSFWDAEMYQGALEAMAVGKVYHQQEETELQNGHGGILEMNVFDTEATDGILEMNVLDTEAKEGDIDVEEAASESSRKLKKSVTFADTVETNSDAEKELRDVLAEQMAELEELGRLLDEEDNDESSNKMNGAIESMT